LTVERLLFVPDLTGAGFNPHPALLAAYDRILLAVTGSSRKLAAGRKLYISRLDSQSRVLVNEREIQAVAESVGCTSVVLSELTFQEQVRLFAEASLIVAPHGAGLTNIGFCRPGTTLCELHMDSYVHWSFRRLAALRGLHYGCVVGETWAKPAPASPGQAWRLDPGRLRDVLKVLVPANRAGQGWVGRFWKRGSKGLLF
jgi:capsular polysaccharide biosynthesis protein